jgi:hypothetical protein
MAAYDFPDTAGKPTDGSFEYTAPDGTLYEWNGYAWVVPTDESGGSGGGAARVLTQVLPPSPAEDGDMYWCTDDGRLYLYYDDADTKQWVDASPDGGGTAPTYWNRNGTTLSLSNAGDDVDLGNIQLNANGALTATASVQTGSYDILTSGIQGGRISGIGTFSSQKTGTGEFFRGYNEVTKTFNVTAEGVLNLGPDVTVATTTNIKLDGSTGTVDINQYCQARGFIIRSANNNGTYADDRTMRSAATGSSSAAVYIGNQRIDTSLPSDRRTKENIVPTATDAVQVLKDIEVVDFNFIGSGLYSTDKTEKRIGFIAQDVETVFPQMITPPENNEDLYTVKNAELVPVLVKGLQTTIARIEALEETNASLEARLTALEGGNN